MPQKASKRVGLDPSERIRVGRFFFDVTEGEIRFSVDRYFVVGEVEAVGGDFVGPRLFPDQLADAVGCGRR